MKFVFLEVTVVMQDALLKLKLLFPGNENVHTVLFTERPDRNCGPPGLLFNIYSGLFPRGVKRQGLEAGRSPPSSAKFKKT
jgi:hypothetical protein